MRGLSQWLTIGGAAGIYRSLPSALREADFLREEQPTMINLIYAHSPHHTHASAPVFVDVEAINFNVGSD